MDLATIGAILKNRIKECGYTQEEFSEKTGISLATLKKQMSGITAIRCDDLIKYAEVLNCSYDYLLGYSNSTERDYHNAMEQTGLSLKSLKILNDVMKVQKDSIEKEYIVLLNEMICHETLFYDLLLYCGSNKAINNMMNNIYSNINTSEKIQTIDFKTIFLGSLINSLADIRMKYQEKVQRMISEDVRRVNDFD